MFIGEIKNLDMYTNLPTSVLEALAQISAEAFCENQPGVYILEDGSPAKVCEYETKTGRRFASHKTYADLTYIVSGEERLTVGDAKNMAVIDYDAERDVTHHEGEGKDYILREGMFSLVVPGDAHRTKQVTDGVHKVKSVIVRMDWKF